MSKTTAEYRAQFARLTERAERELAQEPRAYKRKILLLAILGYLVLALALAGLISLVGGSAWLAIASPAIFLLLVKKKLILVFGFAVYVILRSLWVRIVPPQGRELSRDEAPRLFEVIDELRERLDTSRIHRVVMDDSVNAAMSQTPRFGIVGGRVNTLVLGLPLLLSLSEAQAKSVIAHELGHLSANHAHFNTWIYRVRTTWMRIMDALDENSSWATGWLRRFFNWYAPYFNAYSFALARANEYQADSAAAEFTSVDDAAAALVQVHVTAQLAEADFWNGIQSQLHTDPQIPEDAYYRLNRFMKDPQLDRGRMITALDKALKVETDHVDTHPSLSDRIHALSGTPRLPRQVETNAAEVWLGPVLDKLLDELSQQWKQNNESAWQEQHAKAQQAEARLAELHAKQDELDDMEAWDLAWLTDTYRPQEDALPLYRAYRERMPDDPDVHFALGRLLLQRGDEQGLEHLDRCLNSRPLVFPAAEAAISYLAERQQDYSHWQQAWDRHNDYEIAAAHERNQMPDKASLMAPELPEGWPDYLQEKLNSHGRIAEAWVAFKNLEYFPDYPLVVMTVKPKGLFKRSGKLLAWLQQNIETPYDTFFVIDDGHSKKLTKAVKKIGTQVF